MANTLHFHVWVLCCVQLTGQGNDGAFRVHTNDLRGKNCWTMEQTHLQWKTAYVPVIIDSCSIFWPGPTVPFILGIFSLIRFTISLERNGRLESLVLGNKALKPHTSEPLVWIQLQVRVTESCYYPKWTAFVHFLTLNKRINVNSNNQAAGPIQSWCGGGQEHNFKSTSLVLLRSRHYLPIPHTELPSHLLCILGISPSAFGQYQWRCLLCQIQPLPCVPCLQLKESRNTERLSTFCRSILCSHYNHFIYGLYVQAFCLENCAAFMPVTRSTLALQHPNAFVPHYAFLYWFAFS